VIFVSLMAVRQLGGAQATLCALSVILKMVAKVQLFVDG
jgi:hypothetical protein